MIGKLKMDELFAQGCSVPGCTHEAHEELWVSPVCHLGAPLKVRYYRDGMLHIRCHECDEFVVDIAVGEPRLVQACQDVIARYKEALPSTPLDHLEGLLAKLGGA